MTRKEMRSSLRAPLAGGLIGLLSACVWILVAASPAGAGGSWLESVKDAYQPGERAVLIGYTSGGAEGEAPLLAYLLPEATGTNSDGPLLPLGPLLVERTGAQGYLAYRVSIAFDLPVDLASGNYTVGYCIGTCGLDGNDGRYFGDLIGGFVTVGDPPAAPTSREWAIDDPAWHDVPPATTFAGPGTSGTITAAAIVAGETPKVDWARITEPVTYPPPATPAPAPLPTTQPTPSSTADPRLARRAPPRRQTRRRRRPGRSRLPPQTLPRWLFAWSLLAAASQGQLQPRSRSQRLPLSFSYWSNGSDDHPRPREGLSH